MSKGYGQFVHTLEVLTKGGKQKMNCANTEGIFRIIQSISSPKAEPFKLWLAKTGERVTTEISQQEKPAGMPENKKVARRGGSVAGNARKETEKELGKSIISKNNYLATTRKNKKLGENDK